MKWPEGIESNISLSLNTLDYTQPFRTDWSMRGGMGGVGGCGGAVMDIEKT